MKKLVLAMACVLSLALLASCKQEAATDIAVNNQEFSTRTSYIGTVAVTADPVSLNTTDHAYKSTTSTTDGFKVDSAFATVEWSEGAENTSSNYKVFTLSFKGAIDADTTDNTLPTSYSSYSVKFYEIGDKYYVEASSVDSNNNVTTAKKEIELEDGDPASGSFTFKNIGVLADNTSLNITKVVFTAAE